MLPKEFLAGKKGQVVRVASGRLIAAIKEAGQARSVAANVAFVDGGYHAMS